VTVRRKTIYLALVVLLTASTVRADVVADLPYRIDGNGRVSTDVFINGKGPFSFIVDTASSRTMLFEHLRQQLGLKASGPGLLKVYAMNNVGTATPVKPQEMRLANKRFTDLTMGVLPDDVHPPEGTLGADGILGMDTLSQYFLAMDHDTLRLKLMDPADPAANIFRQWPSEHLTSHRMKDSDITLWWLDAEFGGKTVTALLDMGSGITMINWNAAEKLGLYRSRFADEKVPEMVRDALGTTEPVVVIKELTISLGRRNFPVESVLVANAAVFRFFGLDGKAAAIIGPAILRTNSLAIDFGRRRIYIGPTTIPADKPS
jgi:predicted aspartyl protease